MQVLARTRAKTKNGFAIVLFPSLYCNDIVVLVVHEREARHWRFGMMHLPLFSNNRGIVDAIS